MPELTQAHDAHLKKVMLQRVPDCFFTVDDEIQIMERTGLKLEDIKSWGNRLRWRIQSETLHPPGYNVERYLRSDGESLFDMEEEVPLKRCYVYMLNANADLVMTFHEFMLSDSACDKQLVNSTHFCWNPETRVAEGFIDFNSSCLRLDGDHGLAEKPEPQVSTTDVKAKLREYGATNINVTSLVNSGGEC